jgi:hypothetical protein
MIWGAFLWRFSFGVAVQADPSNAAVVFRIAMKRFKNNV